MYEGLEENIKYKSYLVTRDLGGHHTEEDYFQIPNPYQIIPDVVSKTASFIQDIEANGENVSMKSFIFSEKFKILSTLTDDIQNKGLKEKEIQELNSDCSLLIVKGFLLNQVTIKLTQNDIMALRSDSNDHAKFSQVGEGDDAVQLYSEMKNLLSYFNKIYKNSVPLDEEKLNDLYQAHSNDDSTPILKEFVEEFVPYYKSLSTPVELAKLTYQVSDKYQKLFFNNTIYNFIKKTLPNQYILCPIYLKLIPFKLIDPPGDSYNTLVDIFKVSYHNFHFGQYEKDDYPTLPTEMEEMEEIDTLQKQKYYIASYLVLYLNQRQDTNVDFQDACIIMSLLDWKIESDSKELKDLEDYIKNLVILNLKDYDYKYDGSFFNGRAGLKHFAKYIIKTVNTAAEPIDHAQLSQKLSEFSSRGMQGEYVNNEGCCNIQ